MSIYDRIIGINEPQPPPPGGWKLMVTPFLATVAEYARGKITGAQAQSIIQSFSGEPLTQAEIAEVQTLLGTITGSGTAKLSRVKEIEDCFMLGEIRAPGYDTTPLLKAKVGIA